MKSKIQNYSGSVVDSKEMENFSISIGSHTQDTKVRPHSHKKPYLCLCLDGRYEETTFRNSRVVEIGTCLFRGANFEHANQFYNQDVKLLNVEINDPIKFMEENSFKLPKDTLIRPGTIDLYRLLHFFKCGLPDYLLNILCYESVIMHFDMMPVKGKLDWIRKVKEKIHDDPYSPISLSKLSNEFSLHPNYIVRKFKSITGYKLSDYLNKIRIEMSLAKMIETEDSLTKIALEAGFCDQSHFNRNFKKHFPTSPKNFRKALKG